MLAKKNEKRLCTGLGSRKRIFPSDQGAMAPPNEKRLPWTSQERAEKLSFLRVFCKSGKSLSMSIPTTINLGMEVRARTKRPGEVLDHT